MTVAELIKELEKMPKDKEVFTYTGAFYRLIESVEIKSLNIFHEQKDVVAIYGYKALTE